MGRDRDRRDRDDRDRDRDRERDRDRDRSGRSRRRERDMDSDDEVDHRGGGNDRDDYGYDDGGYDYHHDNMSDRGDYDRSGDDYDGYSNERHGYSQYRSERREKEPSASVMLRGLKPTTSTEMITDSLKAFGPVNAVRLIRNKQTGEPRGFAFVDFQSIDDAINLMAYQNKTLFIDGRTVQLDYSTTPAPPPPSSGGGPFKDWICPQCSVTNFARRNACFSCNVPKPANPQLASQHEDVPGCSLIVKGLSPSTVDDTIRTALSAYSQVKDVRLVRDKQTGVSRCFAFVEFYNVDEATYVLGAAANSLIDGQPIRLSYARHMDHGGASGHHHQSRPSAANPASEQAAWMAYNQQYPNQASQSQQSWQSQPGGEGYSYDSTTGFYYNPATGYYYDEQTKRYMYFDEKSQQFMYFDQATNSYIPYTPSNQATTSTTHIPSPVNSAENVPTGDQSNSNTTSKPRHVISAPPTIAKAPELVPRAVASAAVAATATTTTTATTAPTLAAIDPTPPTTAPVAIPQGPVKMTLKEAKPKKGLSANVPGIFAKKKISQEVARWNQKGKELNEDEIPTPVPEAISSVNSTPINSSQHNNSVTPPAHTSKTEPPQQIPLTHPVEPHPAPIPPANETSHTELESKPICLLCKRQFKTMEQLRKHETLSDLHKTNLELAKQKQASKEMSEQFQQPPHDDANHKRPREEWAEEKKWEQSNADVDWNRDKGKNRKTEQPGGALGESNIGYQMMKNFGWQGGGLGKTGEGMVAPIEVNIRSERAGLGSEEASDSRYYVQPGDSYKQATRKKALSRFEAITNINVAEVNANHPFLKKRGQT